MEPTPGKHKGLQAVSDQRGVIAALAMDQRGSLKRALGPTAADRQLEEFKAAVTEVLTPYASAVLLDPEWGLPASKRRAHGSGLFLAYEKTGYDNSREGRLPDLLEHWSVRRLKEADADCVKALLYYNPFESAEVNDTKHAWVERIGGECSGQDIPFFLELVGYEKRIDPQSLEYAKRKPGIVHASAAEFTKSQYGVDVLKVEVPVNLKFVEGTRAFEGTKAYSREEALRWFREASGAITKPFIYLSAGVSNPEFTETLQLAAEARVRFSGVLCGRATWKDGIPIYQKEGVVGLTKWLQEEGVKNISRVNECLRAAAPWHTIYRLQAVS